MVNKKTRYEIRNIDSNGVHHPISHYPCYSLDEAKSMKQYILKVSIVGYEESELFIMKIETEIIIDD